MKQSSGEMSRENAKVCPRSDVSAKLKCELEDGAVAPCSVIASAAKIPWGVDSDRV